MGHYSDFYISQLPIYSDESIDPFILSLFNIDELTTFERNVSERIQVLHGRDKTEMEQAYVLRATARVIKERLEVSGFTRHRVLEKFEESKSLTISMLKDNKDISEGIQEEINLLEKSNFQDFIDVAKKKFETENADTPASLEDKLKELYAYVGKRDFNKFPHHHDHRVLIRSLLECVPDDTIVTYDITELVENHYDPEYPEEIFDDFLSAGASGHQLNEKIIVLTEGSSDVQILKGAISILYPHLANYYSFMDFGNSNAGGGVGPLVGSVKSFAGSGITNRVIAIFDNDTAAEVAIRGLAKTAMPSNIKVLRFPTNKLATNYPTIGPAGISNMDINGLACSIELYLGTDALLRKDSAELTPVHWKGYDQIVNKYQGEIVDKGLVQDRYHEKVKVCLDDPKKIEQFDWEEMHSLLRTIFDAFNADNDEYFENFLEQP